MTNSSIYFGEHTGAPDPAEWNGQSVIPVTVMLTLIASIAVGSRMYTRTAITNSLGWSDWFILVALVRQSVYLFVPRKRGQVKR